MARSTAKPAQVFRKNLPGRMQIVLNFYERTRRVHRPVPGHALSFDVETPAEARLLFAAVKAVVDGGQWRADMPEPAAEAGKTGCP